MKKLLTMAVTLLASTTMFAQQKDQSFTLTPKAGITIANSSVDMAKAKVGFIGGIETGYQATDNLAITFGVNYAQYGYKLNDTFCKLVGIDNIKVNMNYIAMPILANYYITKGLAVKAGVEVAFKTSAELSNGDISMDFQEFYKLMNTQYNLKNNVQAKSVILSIPVGVSYEYNNIILDARYNIGVSNALSGNFYDIADGKADATLSQFVITLGYKFKL